MPSSGQDDVGGGVVELDPDPHPVQGVGRGVVHHRGEQDRVSRMEPVPQEEGQLPGLGFRSRGPDAEHDLAEELAPLGHDHVEVVQHPLGHLASLGIDQIHRHSPHPAVDGHRDRPGSRLLNLAVARVGRQRVQTDLHGVLTGGHPADPCQGGQDAGTDGEPRPDPAPGQATAPPGSVSSPILGVGRGPIGAAKSRHAHEHTSCSG